MAQFKAIVKRWGNSLGVVLPKGVIAETKIKPGQEVEVILPKKVDLSKIFGTLKDWKKPTQKIMEEIDKGWDGN